MVLRVTSAQRAQLRTRLYLYVLSKVAMSNQMTENKTDDAQQRHVRLSKRGITTWRTTIAPNVASSPTTTMTTTASNITTTSITISTHQNKKTHHLEDASKHNHWHYHHSTQTGLRSTCNGKKGPKRRFIHCLGLICIFSFKFPICLLTDSFFFTRTMHTPSPPSTNDRYNH